MPMETMTVLDKKKSLLVNILKKINFYNQYAQNIDNVLIT